MTAMLVATWVLAVLMAVGAILISCALGSAIQRMQKRVETLSHPPTAIEVIHRLADACAREDGTVFSIKVDQKVMDSIWKQTNLGAAIAGSPYRNKAVLCVKTRHGDVEVRS